ncbi:MAG: outer membrane beta-barrel protein [Sulfurovaceae bacterium]
MRRILLFSVVVSTMIMAGGDIAPVEQAPEVAQGAFYIGAGYSNIQGVDRQNFMTEAVGITQLNGYTPYNVDFDADGVMFQVGYKFNPYMAIEGRYTTSVGDVNLDNAISDNFIKQDISVNEDLDADISNLAIYIKPMYPFGNANIYALLGYGKVKLDNNNGTSWDDNSFQWGIGASYAFNEHLSVFVDGVRWYHDTISEVIVPDGGNPVDRKIYAFSVGLTYTF